MKLFPTRHIVRPALLVFLSTLFSSTFAGDTQTAVKTPTPTLQLVSATKLSACTTKSDCINVVMPEKVGKVTTILQAPFVTEKETQASWIALAGNSSSLCYLYQKSAWCRPVHAVVPPDLDIRTELFKGRPVILFSPKTPSPPGARRSAAVLKSAQIYQHALSKAIDQARRNAIRRASAPPTTNVIDAGDCDSYDEDGWCDGGGGGGGGGGGWYDDPGSGGDDPGGGGGNDDPGTGGNDNPGAGGDEPGSGGDEPGNGDEPYDPGSNPGGGSNDTTMECHWVGPVWTCVITGHRDPAEDPPLPAPDRPWYCRMFGIFCDEPAVPPREAEPPEPEVGTPPSVSPPPIPWDGQPYTRYRDGYEEAVDECVRLYGGESATCDVNWILMGGNRNKKKADAEFARCMRVAGENLERCMSDARDEYRIP